MTDEPRRRDGSSQARTDGYLELGRNSGFPRRMADCGAQRICDGVSERDGGCCCWSDRDRRSSPRGRNRQASKAGERMQREDKATRRQDETRDGTSGTDAKLADDDGEGYLKGGEATKICETKWEQGAFVQVLPWSERSKLTSESSTRLGWGKKGN